MTDLPVVDASSAAPRPPLRVAAEHLAPTENFMLSTNRDASSPGAPIPSAVDVYLSNMGSASHFNSTQRFEDDDRTVVRRAEVRSIAMLGGAQVVGDLTFTLTDDSTTGRHAEVVLSPLALPQRRAAFDYALVAEIEARVTAAGADDVAIVTTDEQLVAWLQLAGYEIHLDGSVSRSLDVPLVAPITPEGWEFAFGEGIDAAVVTGHEVRGGLQLVLPSDLSEAGEALRLHLVGGLDRPWTDMLCVTTVEGKKDQRSCLQIEISGPDAKRKALVRLPAATQFDQRALADVVELVGDLRQAFPELSTFTVDLAPIKFPHATKLSTRKGDTIRVHDGLVLPATIAALQTERDDAARRGIVVKVDRSAARVAVAEKMYQLIAQELGSEQLKATTKMRYLRYALFTTGGSLLFSPPVGALFGAGLVAMDHSSKKKIVTASVDKAAFTDEVRRRMQTLPSEKSWSFLTRTGLEHHRLKSEVSSKAAVGSSAEELFVGTWCRDELTGPFAAVGVLFRRTAPRERALAPPDDFMRPPSSGRAGRPGSGGRPAV